MVPSNRQRGAEQIAAEQINGACEPVLSADVRYRFIIDAHSL